MAPTTDEVVLRAGADRAVLIGPVPAAPAGRAVLGVPGGELHLDPAAPDDPPLAVLREPGAAAGELVADLFGPGARDADPSAGPVTLAWSPGPGWETVRRAAVARWLRRHGPDVLPPALIELEEGVAGVTAGLADDDHLAAAGLLAAHAGTVVRLGRLLREPDRPEPPPGVPELLETAVRAALDEAPLDAATSADLGHERELTEALRRFGMAGRTLSWAALAALPEIGGREPAAAVSAGVADGPAEHVGSVDWYQVPRGVLDTSEHTVRWSLDGDVLDVSVLARPGGPDHGGLAFRVYAPDDPFPLGRSALRRSPDGTLYRGRTRLRARPDRPASLTVDVFDAADRRGPRLGIEATRARAVRWSARAVTLVRLGGTGLVADGVADRVAAEALREAEALHDEVSAGHPSGEHRDLARRRAARCAGLRRAVLLRAGQAGQAAAVGRLWAGEPEPVTTLDVVVPDLASPGWSPLAAEHALFGDPVWRT